MEELKVKEPDWDKLVELYQMFEFNSLLSKIPDVKFKKQEDPSYKVKYKLLKDNKFKDITDELDSNKEFGFKFVFEDENYMRSSILGIGIKVADNIPYYIDFSENNIDVFVNTFKKYFESEDIKKHGHMMKVDIVGLLRLDIHINGVKFDTMIGEYILDPAQSSYSVNKIAMKYLNISCKEEEELLGKGKHKKTYGDLSIETRAEYISTILDLVYKVKELIKEKIKELEMDCLYYEVELPLVEVLADMEHTGFKVDLEVLEQLGEDFESKINSLTDDIYKLAGQEFNINSPKQLGEVLFDKLNLPVIKRTKTGYSTDAEVLDKLRGQHEIIDKILKYRQLVKLKTTYIDGLMNLVDKKTHKIHSSFNQTVTNTGRISSTEPNLQNIPIKTEEGRKIRKAFVPKSKDYVLVDGDYSQIELRVLAHLSKDPKLIEAFFRDEDIHTKTASEIFNIPKDEVTPAMRNKAKAVNFGIIYGISDYGLSRDLNIPRKEAKEYIDNYLENYKMVSKYMEDIIEIGKKKGYVKTILNRRRYVPELKSKNFNVRSFGERIAMNTPIQGSAADIIKVAMVKIYKELRNRNLRSKLILQVHDELIIETHKDELDEVKQLMKDTMENAIKLDVPLKVEIGIGDNWYEIQ